MSSISVALPVHLFPSAASHSFDVAGNVALPAIGASAIVAQFAVDPGFNGIIKRFANVFIGGGFQDGQGGVVWQLLVNGVPVAWYDNILNSLGSVSAPSEVSSIRIKEGDIVTLQVTNVSIAGAGQIVGGRLGGWFYPTEEEPEGSL